MVKTRWNQPPLDQATCPQVIFPLTYSDILVQLTYSDIFAAFYFQIGSLRRKRFVTNRRWSNFPTKAMIYRWHILYKGLWSTCNVGSHKTDACGIKQVFSLQGHIWFQRYFSHQAKLKFAAERQLASLVEWAKHIPHFTELPLEDQVNTLTPLIIFLS